MAHPTANGKQAGFTYIALLIAIAILGGVLASTGTVWHTLVQREREKDLLYAGAQFRQALNRYFLINQRYPFRLDQLVHDADQATVRRHLRKIFVDPMTRRADWGTVKQADGQIIGVYSLSGDAPLKIGGFRPRDAGLKAKKKYSEWVFMADGQSAAPTGGLVNR